MQNEKEWCEKMTFYLALIFISFTFMTIFKNSLKFIEQLNCVSSQGKHTYTPHQERFLELFKSEKF